MSIINDQKSVKTTDKTKMLTDLANFSGQAQSPRKNRSEFWNAFKGATTANMKRTKPTRVSDLLAAVMAISARTRRVLTPRTCVELDVFTPDGKRAVQLIMGNYS